jgi:hypothetical protein
MKTYLHLFFITVFLLVSCGDDQKEAQEKLLDKVMVVHDEIMPKMGAIMKYKKQLKAKIDELTAEGKEDNEARIAELKEAIESLDNSHEGMMNWMREFDTDFEGKVEEDVMSYLNGQMVKIEEVGKMTNLALKKAEDLLKE